MLANPFPPLSYLLRRQAIWPGHVVPIAHSTGFGADVSQMKYERNTAWKRNR